MNPPHCLVVRGWKTLLAVALLAVPLVSVNAGAEEDPLAFLSTPGAVEEGGMRLSMALLEVPAAEMAGRLAQEGRAGAMPWEQWLRQAHAEKKLVTVAVREATAAPGKEFQAGYQRPYRYIRQGEASQLWNATLRQEVPGLNPQLWETLLQDLGEEPVGTLATGRMAPAPDQGGAELVLNFQFHPPPQKRASPAWEQPYFHAPKMLFRTWQLQAHALVPLKVPFLLGVQMAPDGEDAPEGGRVWALFGRLTLAPGLARQEMKGPPLESGAGAVQSWTLDLPVKPFQAWLAARRSDAEDDAFFQQWLPRAAAAADGARVLAVVSAATAPGRAGTLAEHSGTVVRSQLKWDDASGFEPSHNDRVFRPNVAEGEEFHRIHELEVEFEGTTLRQGASAPLLNVALSQSQPSTPLRWRKWKHAMEGTEADPGNLEMADAIFDNNEGRSLRTRMGFLPGRTVLTGATLRHGRVQALFARIHDGTRPPQAGPGSPAPAPAPAPTPAVAEGPGDPFSPGGTIPAAAEPQVNTTVWQIDTPPDWMKQVLAAEPDQSGPLAVRLLEAVAQDQATLVTLNTRSQFQGKFSASQWDAAEPVNYYGGAYVNTAPHAGGIYFNMRRLGQQMVGGHEVVQVELHQRDGFAEVTAQLDASSPPAWRHWGIWQPSVAGTNATNSGILRPAFPTADLKLSVQLPLGAARVVAVAPAPLPATAPATTTEGGTKPPPAARGLRWWVMRTALDDGALPSPGAPAPQKPHASFGQVSSLIQAVVLPLPKSEAVPAPAESRALAARLLQEAEAGIRPVLDVATLFRLGPPEEEEAVLRAGTDLHFTNGRAYEDSRDKTALIHAPAAMPPGTKYEDQITFDHRLVGLVLEVTDKTWKLTRDNRLPQVVTDTFQGVEYEFPYDPAKNRKTTSVSVERPIFDVSTAEGDLPAAGQALVVRLGGEMVVVLREGRVKG